MSITIQGNKTVTIHGVEHTRARLIAQNASASIIAVKFDGGRHWAPVGAPRKYHPPEIIVYAGVPARDGTTTILGNHYVLLSWETGRNK